LPTSWYRRVDEWVRDTPVYSPLPKPAQGEIAPLFRPPLRVVKRPDAGLRRQRLRFRIPPDRRPLFVREKFLKKRLRFPVWSPGPGVTRREKGPFLSVLSPAPGGLRENGPFCPVLPFREKKTGLFGPKIFLGEKRAENGRFGGKFRPIL